MRSGSSLTLFVCCRGGCWGVPNTSGEQFEHGINAAKYRSLAGVSKATATRDLADLLEKGCLRELPGGGRSTRYAVAL